MTAPAIAPSTPGPRTTTPTRFSGGPSPTTSAKAVALQDEALAVARDLGMRPLTERVLAHRKLPKA